jgi:hypothetical protein
MQNLDQRIRPRANVVNELATAQHAESRFDDVRGAFRGAAAETTARSENCVFESAGIAMKPSA